MMKIELNGKTVGEVKGDTYTTIRDVKKHFYMKRQGYPISVSILERLKRLGVKKIVVEEHGRKDKRIKRHRCFVSDFDHVSSFKEEGYDEQKCIPLRRWEQLC